MLTYVIKQRDKAKETQTLNFNTTFFDGRMEKKTKTMF